MILNMLYGSTGQGSYVRLHRLPLSISLLHLSHPSPPEGFTRNRGALLALKSPGLTGPVCELGSIFEFNGRLQNISLCYYDYPVF